MNRIVKNLSNEDYHSGAGISKSGLDLIHRSPAHYMESRMARKPETESMVLGSAIHSAILEPDLFTQQYVTAPVCNRRTNAGKEEYAAFELFAAQEHKRVLSADQFSTAMSIRDAVFRHAAAKTLLSAPGDAEVSFFWNDTESLSIAGLSPDFEECKCRPDFLRTDGIVVDIKSTTDARPDEFIRSVAKYRYYVQQAYYMDGITAVMGESPREFAFLCVEKEPPYGVGIFILNTEAITLGRLAYKADLNRYLECKMRDEWPCYSDEVQILELPKWVA